MQKKNTKVSLDVQKESVIQAVVIADCYGNNFLPACDIPCLLPVVNRPLLDYTLQTLSLSKVQETIIFCTVNADKIKSFVEKKKWGRMVVTVVVSDGCASVGDAMRDLDAKALIRGDFILLTGDIIGNVQLLPALEFHKQMQKADKGVAMTLVYKECGRKTKSDDDEVLLAVDKSTNRLLLHQRGQNIKKFNILVDILLEQSDVDIRNDLLDSKISICSITTPPLFSDNFDFQTRDDFVRGLLMNEEILASTLYSYIMPSNEYAACVSSWQNYHYISHDIIHRWTYPVVPDTNYDDSYNFKRNNIYLQEKVTLSKNCHIVEDVVLGEGSVLKENSKLNSSVIGKNCEIGRNAFISNSHLFSNVKIEDGCMIDHCVLGEGAVLKTGVKLNSCVIGPGVEIDKNKVISNRRLQSTKSSGESFGPKAYEYTEEKDDSDSDSEAPGDEWKGLRIETKTIIESEEETDSEELGSEHGSTIPDDTNLFYSEVIDSLLRGFEEQVPCDNLVLEVNSSRYAYNVTVNEVNYYVVKAILMIKDDLSWDTIRLKLKYFMPLFVNYMKNESAMADCLSAIEDVAEMNPSFRDDVMKLLNALYQKDIISEESVLKWFTNPRDGGEVEMQIREKVKPFIKWLQEAEESESE